MNDEISYGEPAMTGKLETVREAKHRKAKELFERKSHKMNNQQKIIKGGWQDADTVTTKGKYDDYTTTHRFAGGVDTAEMDHGAKRNAQNQSNISRQKPRIADELGIPVTQVTNQMVFDFGAQEKRKAQIEAATGQAWTPELDESMKDVNLDELEYDVNISSTGELGAYGRQISSFNQAGTDLNLNQQALNRGAVSEFAARAGTTGDGLEGFNVDQAKIDNAIATQAYADDRQTVADQALREDMLTEAPKAGATMMLSAFGDVGDFVLDIAGAAVQKVGDVMGMDPVSDTTLANMGFVRRKDGSVNNVLLEDNRAAINDIFGYDDRFEARDRKQFSDSIISLYNNDQLSMPEKMITAGQLIGSNLNLVPSLTTESLGFLTALGFGGFLKVGSVASGSKAAKAAEAFGMTGAKVTAKLSAETATKAIPAAERAAKAANRLMGGAGKGSTATMKLKGAEAGAKAYGSAITNAVTKVSKERVAISAAGMPLALAETNKNMEEFRKENNGKAPTMVQTAGIALLSSVSVKLDHLIDRSIVGGNLGKKMKQAVMDSFEYATKTQAKTLIGKLGKTLVANSVKLAGEGATEAATETLQEALNIVAQRFGAEKWQNKDMFDEATLKQLAEAGILGAMGGIGMSGAGAVNNIRNDMGVDNKSIFGAGITVARHAYENMSKNGAERKIIREIKEARNITADLLAGREVDKATPGKTKAETVKNGIKHMIKNLEGKDGNINAKKKAFHDILTGYISVEYNLDQTDDKSEMEPKIAETITEILKDPELSKIFNKKAFTTSVINDKLDALQQNIATNTNGRELTPEEIEREFDMINPILNSLNLTDEEKVEAEAKLQRAKDLLAKYMSGEVTKKDMDDVASEVNDIGFINIDKKSVDKKSFAQYNSDINADILDEVSPGLTMSQFKDFATSRIDKLFSYDAGKHLSHSPRLLEQIKIENNKMLDYVTSMEANVKDISDQDIKAKYEKEMLDIRERVNQSNIYIESMMDARSQGKQVVRNDKYGKSTATSKTETTQASTQTSKDSQEQPKTEKKTYASKIEPTPAVNGIRRGNESIQGNYGKEIIRKRLDGKTSKIIGIISPKGSTVFHMDVDEKGHRPKGQILARVMGQLISAISGTSVNESGLVFKFKGETRTRQIIVLDGDVYAHIRQKHGDKELVYHQIASAKKIIESYNNAKSEKGPQKGDVSGEFMNDFINGLATEKSVGGDAAIEFISKKENDINQHVINMSKEKHTKDKKDKGFGLDTEKESTGPVDFGLDVDENTDEIITEVDDFAGFGLDESPIFDEDGNIVEPVSEASDASTTPEVVINEEGEATIEPVIEETEIVTETEAVDSGYEPYNNGFMKEINGLFHAYDNALESIGNKKGYKTKAGAKKAITSNSKKIEQEERKRKEAPYGRNTDGSIRVVSGDSSQGFEMSNVDKQQLEVVSIQGRIKRARDSMKDMMKKSNTLIKKILHFTNRELEIGILLESEVGARKKELEAELSIIVKNRDKIKEDIEKKKGDHTKLFDEIDTKEKELKSLYEDLKAGNTLLSLAKLSPNGTAGARLFAFLDETQQKIFKPKMIDEESVSIFDKFISPILDDSITVLDMFNVLPKSKKKLFSKKETLQRFVSSRQTIKSFIDSLSIPKIINNIELAGYKNKSGEFVKSTKYNMNYSLTEDGKIDARNGFNPLALIAKAGEDTDTSRKGDKGVLKFDKTTTEIIALKALQMYSSAKSMSRETDEKQIGLMFALSGDTKSDGTEALMAAKDYLAKGLVPRAALISATGKEIFSALGLQVRDDIDESLEEQMISALGGLAMAVNTDLGILPVGDLFTEGDKSFYMVKTHEITGGDTGPLSEQLRQSINDFDHLVPSARKKTIQLEPIVTKDQSIKNASGYKKGESQSDFTNQMQSRPWSFNTLLETMTKMPKEMLMRSAGWKDISKMNINDVPAQQSINLQIEMDLEAMFDNYSMFGTSDFYIPWATTKSDRDMMEGVVNPQGSKIFRFVMGTGGMSYVMNRKDLSDKSGNMKTFKVALAQAFDLDPDKKTDETALKDVEANFAVIDYNKGVIAKTSEMKLALDFFSDPEANKDNIDMIDAVEVIAGKGEHFHAIQALEALAGLDKFIKDKNAKDFKTDLMIEADAVTSGMALTLLQMGGTVVAQELLKKTGVYSKKAIKELKNKYNENLKDGQKPITEKDITHGLLNETEWFQDFYTDIGFQVFQGINGVGGAANKLKALNQPMNKRSNKDVGGGLFLQITNEDFVKEGGLVKKAIRNIAKSPVMVYIYGSSINSIRKKLAYTMGRDKMIKLLSKKEFKDIEYNKIKNFSDRVVRPAREKPSDNSHAKIIQDMVTLLSDPGAQEALGIKGISDKNIQELTYLAVMIEYANHLKEWDPFAKEFVHTYNTPQFKYVGEDGVLTDTEHEGKGFGPDDTLGNLFIPDVMTLNLKQLTDPSFGDEFEVAFESTFGEVNDYRDALKSAEVMVHSIFEFQLDKKIKTYADKNGDITKGDMRKALEEVIAEGNGHNQPNIYGSNQGLEKKETGRNYGKNITVTSSNVSSTLSGEDVVQVNKMLAIMFGEEALKAKNTTVQDTIKLNVYTKEYISNIRAVATISIHSIDGYSLKAPVSESEILHIYDAIGASVDAEQYKKSSDLYNDRIMQASREYSFMKEFMNKLDTMIQSMKDNDEYEDFKNSLFKDIENDIDASIDGDGKLSYKASLFIANESKIVNIINALESGLTKDFIIDNDAKSPENFNPMSFFGIEKFQSVIDRIIKGRQDLLSQDFSLNHMYNADIDLRSIPNTDKNNISVPDKLSDNIEEFFNFMSDIVTYDKLPQSMKKDIEKRMKKVASTKKDKPIKIETENKDAIGNRLLNETLSFGNKIVDIVNKSKKKVVLELDKNFGFAEDILFGEAPFAGLHSIIDGVSHIQLPDLRGLAMDSKTVARIAKKHGLTDVEVRTKAMDAHKAYSTGFTKVHEYIHAISEDFIDKNPNDPKVKYLQHVYQKMNDYMDANPDHKLNQKGFNYWKTDVKEFIAEALAKPHMIEFLSTFDVDMKPTLEPKTSILGKMIAKLIQMMPNKHVTGKTALLDNMVSTLMSIATEQETDPEPTKKKETEEKKKEEPKEKFEAKTYAEKANMNYDKANELFYEIEVTMIDDSYELEKLGKPIPKEDYDIMENAAEMGEMTPEVEKLFKKYFSNKAAAKMIDIANRIGEFRKEGDYNTKKDEEQQDGKDTLYSIDGKKKKVTDAELIMNEDLNLTENLDSIILMLMAEDELLVDNGEEGYAVVKKEDAGYLSHIETLAQEMQNNLVNNDLIKMLNVKIHNIKDTSYGSIDVKNSKLNMFMKKDGDKMFNMTEIFMHELVHLFTESAFNINPGMRIDIRRVQEKVAKQLDYTVFLDSIEKPTSEDVDLAKTMYDYAILGDESEFIAYSMTNKNLIKAMSNIEIDFNAFGFEAPKNYMKEFKDAKNFEKIAVLFKIMASLFGSMLGSLMKSKETGITPKESGDFAANEIMESFAKKLMSIQAELESDIINKREAKKDKTVVDKFKTKYKKLESSLNTHSEKFSEKIDDLLAAGDKKIRGNSFIDKITELNVIRQLKATRIFQDIYNEITVDTTNEKVAGFYDLFRVIKKIQEADKEKERSAIKTMIHNQLPKSTENERKAAKRVLVDTDVAYLLSNGYSMAQVARMIRDEKILQTEIDTIRKTIGDKSITGREYLEQAEGLGYYMVNGESPVINQMKNAQNIYNGFFSGGKDSEYHKLDSNPEQMIANIEKLASLYAIKYSGKENKGLASELLSRNAKGAETVVTMYEEFEKQSYSGLDLSTPDISDMSLKIKGYTKSLFDDSKEVKSVKASEIKDFEKLGYKVLRKVHVDSSLYDGEQMFVMVGQKIDPTYHKGAIDIISFNAKGTSMKEMIRVNGNTESFAEDVIQKYIDDNSRHRAPGTELNLDSTMTMRLLPKLNMNGSISDFSTEMSNKEKREIMTMNNDIAEVIADTMTNTIATISSLQQNTKVIEYLIDDAQRHYASNKEQFIAIEPDTGLRKSKTAEQWKMIPEKTRDLIFERTGENKLLVRASLMNDVIGYKSFALGEIAFLKKNFPKVARALAILEDGWMSIVTKFKGIIVTMTGSVVLANMVSNMMFSWQHGVDPVKFAKHSIDAWKLLTQYELDSAALDELKYRKLGGEKNLDGKMMRLTAKLEKNKMHKLISEGMFTPIVDDVNIGETRTNSTIDKFIDKHSKKLPDAARKTLDVLYLNENTTIYKKMLKLIQYGDISARYAVLEEKKKDKNFNEKKMMRYLDQMLVNYSYNENKYLRYVNDIGLFMFSKYFFRTPKAIVRMMRKSPTFAALFQGAQNVTGIDVVDPLDTYHDIFGALTNRISNPLDIVGTIVEPHIFAPITGLGSVVHTS